MFSSVFEKFRTPSQQHQRQQEAPVPGWGGPGRSDQEEDGFLVVGETASERNTIMPSHLVHVRQGAASQPPPPSYESQVFQQTAVGSVCQPTPGPWSAHIPASHPSSTVSSVLTGASNPAIQAPHAATGHGQTYAAQMLADVPFQLAEDLDFSHKLAVNSSYFAIPPLPRFQPDKYFYDFEHERRVIRESEEFYQ